MKRFSVILLVPLLLFNTIGYYLVFYGDLLSVKHEAEVLIWGHERMGDKMVSLTFPMQNGSPVAVGLTFTDEDEFMYQGRMYDVVSSTKENGHIVLKCYTDSKETALNDNLCNKINSDTDSPAQSHKNNSILKEFVKDYTPHKIELFFISPVLIKSYAHISRSGHQPYIYSSIASPPPESL